MPKGTAAIVLLSGLILLCACNRKAPSAEAATGPAAPTVNASMTQVMSVQAQTIWDITSKAFNARGDGLEPSKISSQDWSQLSDAAQKLRDRAFLLAAAKSPAVAGPGETILGADAAGQTATIGHAWDAASAHQIQARIDAHPALFAQRARTLGEAMDTVVKASQTKDTAKLYEVSSGLDDTCDGCHEKFWGTDEPPPFPKADQIVTRPPNRP